MFAVNHAKLVFRKKRFAVPVCVGILIVAGCETKPEKLSITPLTVSQDWIEPDWMSAHRIKGVAYQDAVYDCVVGAVELAEQQLDIALNIRPVRHVGDWDFGVIIIPNPSGTPPETFEVADSAQINCRVQHPFPDFGGHDATPTLYARMVDTRDCIIAHGFEVASPPDMNDWISLGGNWNPFSRLSHDVRNSTDTMNLLLEACPQSGPGWFVNVLQ